MVGGVTCQMLPHLTGVSHLHVNRPLALQNSVVVVKNNGKETQKAAARENLVFLLIRSIDLDAVFIAIPV